MAAAQNVGIALGAGAARGLAHIGILQVLTENGVPIHCVAGSSVGAVIGSLFAAGVELPLLAKMAKAMRWDDLVGLTISRSGLVSTERIYQMLRFLTKDRRIEQLDIPAAFVAADLRTGNEVVFQEGSAAFAVRASLSIPGVFVPVESNGRVLVDGGLLNRIPVDVARDRLGADVVIAADLGFSDFRGRLRSLPDIILRTIDILERQAAVQEPLHADVVISPPLSDVGSTQLNRASEVIERGRRAAEESLPEIWNRLRSEPGASDR